MTFEINDIVIYDSTKLNRYGNAKRLDKLKGIIIEIQPKYYMPDGKREPAILVDFRKLNPLKNCYDKWWVSVNCIRHVNKQLLLFPID